MAPTTHSSDFPGNRVKALLRAGRPAFGVFATIPSVAIVQIMAASGLDWVLIDMEHGAIDYATAHAMIAATTGTRTGADRASGGHLCRTCQAAARSGGDGN